MSTLANMAYDIEQLYIDGFSPSRIANILEIPLGIVYDWMDEQNVVETQQSAQFDPFNTVNS